MKPFPFLSRFLTQWRNSKKAHRIARQVRRELVRQGFIYRANSKKKKQTILFKDLLLTPDELWIPIRTDKLPYGTVSSDLKKDEVLEGIADRLGMGEKRGTLLEGIRIDYLPTQELCYVIPFHGVRFPASFAFSAFDWKSATDILRNASHDPLPRLAIPLGIDATKGHRYVDLEDIKHLLIGGTTGNGKSTLLHSILMTLMQRNSPLDVQFWLVDAKRTELSMYKKLMKRGGGFVTRIETEPQSILGLLYDLSAELDRRQRDQAHVGAVNMIEFARITGAAYPHIILVVDELADVILNKEKEGKQTIGKLAENVIARLARQGRSAGIHIIAATQHPTSEVLTSQVKANMGARIAFNTVDHYRSMTILDDSRAVGLPRGRCFFRGEDIQFHQIQTCMVHSQQVRIAIDAIEKGEQDGKLPAERQRFLTDAKILVELSAVRFGGSFAYRDLHSSLNGQLPRDRITEIAWQLEKDNILQPARGRRPRILYPIFRGEKRMDMLDSIYAVPGDQPGTHEVQDSVKTTIDHSQDGFECVPGAIVPRL